MVYDCQICFELNDNEYYSCSCKSVMCYNCISEYIKHSSSMLCKCKRMIEITKLPSSLDNLDIYKNAILKKIELNNFSEVVSIKEQMQKNEELMKRRRKSILTFPKCVQYAIKHSYVLEMKKIKLNLENKSVDYTKICNNSWCNGTVVDDKCNYCNTKHCDKCKEISKVGHVCDKNILANIDAMENYFNCPKCKLPIEKSYGCSYMTCAACGTNFDHTRNEIIQYGGHSIPVKVSVVNNELIMYLSDKISNDKIEKLRVLLEKNEPSNKGILIAYSKKDYNKAIEMYEKYTVAKYKLLKAKEKLKYLSDNKEDISLVEKILT